MSNSSESSRDSSAQQPSEGRNARKMWSDEQKTAFWKQKRKEKKARKQERNASKKVTQQEKWQSLTVEEQNALRAQALVVHESRRAEKEAFETLCNKNLSSDDTPIIIFDLSFWDTMTEAGKKSTIAQIKFSFSALKKHSFCFKPVLTSYNENDTLQKGLKSYEGFKHFTPQFFSEPFHQIFGGKPCIYLSADSSNVLNTIESGQSYVVGAFVDHNSKKGATENFATAHNVKTARLPISETLKDVGNLCKVLTINHVTECLTTYMQTGSWETAFSLLPTRRRKDDEATADDQEIN